MAAVVSPPRIADGGPLKHDSRRNVVPGRKIVSRPFPQRAWAERWSIHIAKRPAGARQGGPLLKGKAGAYSKPSWMASATVTFRLSRERLIIVTIGSYSVHPGIALRG